MNENQKQAALEAMIEWISDPQVLGKMPHAIEFAGSIDLYDMKYYIFKFKKSGLGKWLLGVSGGYEADSMSNCGYVFSKMEPYRDDTAEQIAIETIDFVRNYWIEMEELYGKDE